MMNSDSLQRIVSLARIVLQVDGIDGREAYATSHLVSTEDLRATVVVPPPPDEAWRIELAEADTELMVGAGATAESALADLRAKVDAAATCVLHAIRMAQDALAAAEGTR